MKQSAAKTLGVAALGAAFAAAGAGAANAAPSVPEVASDLGATARTLPAEVNTETLDAAQHAVTTTTGQVAASTLPAPVEAAPVTGLLGGLPAGGLPTSSLPLNPLGLG